jgi:uncharacterized membrane-anchored protein YhcB (DUF1043 family)
MILTALKQSPKSAGSKFSKATFQKSGLKAREFLSPPTSKTKYSTGEQWTKELIEFFLDTATHFGKSGAQSYTHLEKTAQTTPALAPDKQPQQRVGHMHTPAHVSHDRRVLDVPLQERLQSRTTELVAWARTMLRHQPKRPRRS